jgi:hypothetical protein
MSSIGAADARIRGCSEMATSGVKAFLEIESGSPPNKHLPCMFNPNELTMNFSAVWTSDSIAGRDATQSQFGGGSAGTLSVELLFDTTDEGKPVTKYTDDLVSLMHVNSALPGTKETTNNARPSTVTFHWGSLHSFQAVVTSLQLTFLYFASDGTPLRAKASLSLQEYCKDVAGTNPSSGTPFPHRVHRVQPGETLDRISALHYGDATKWRLIADGNNLQDPLDLRPGSLLSIPEQI